MKTANQAGPAASAAAARQLEGFIRKFDPNNQALIRAVRKALRRRLPTAHELVYDNYNFFVVGYCSTERPSDCIVSIAAGSNGVGLSFYHGATLPDPEGAARQRQAKPFCSPPVGGGLGAPGGQGAHCRRCVASQDAVASDRTWQAHHPIDFR